MYNDIFKLCTKSETDGSDSNNSDESKIDITTTDQNRKIARDLISLLSKTVDNIYMLVRNKSLIDTVDM